jgi:hypothetical protein
MVPIGRIRRTLYGTWRATPVVQNRRAYLPGLGIARADRYRLKLIEREVCMRTTSRIGLAVTAALVLAGTLAIGVVSASGGRTFNLALSSAAEVPTPTDEATGTAWLQINPGQQRVCFAITWDDVSGTVVASHIHVAPAGTAGPVLVPLFVAPQVSDENGDGSASGCVTTDLSAPELAAIASNPSAYYVNVHSTDNPAGAIRAQLSD